MLNNPTLSSLHTLGCNGMADAFTEQLDSTQFAELSFEERFALIVDRESSEREARKLATRLRAAKLRQSASIEDISFRSQRNLNRSQIMSLASSQWVASHHNILITGPTGVGKSFLACALCHGAIRQGHTALYRRASRLFDDLAAARADGRYPRLLASLARVDILCIDDFGLSSLSGHQPTDLLEILEDRTDRRSTMVTSQLPVDAWHKLFPDPTYGDAILDRLTHSAFSLPISGASMRHHATPKGGTP
ncbi:MAG: IS21-like element helper ATPase IstB [Acidimicrobiales bacterium]